MNLEKMGQEQPTLVLLYTRHNNIRTNVGAVTRNGTKLLVVISMALLRYITVVLKNLSINSDIYCQTSQIKTKKQFWYNIGVLKKSKNQSNNLLQTCQLFHENLKFLQKPELEIFWFFDFQKRQVIWFLIFKRGPRPGCDALLCLTSCSCVLSNALCYLSPWLLVTCASRNLLGLVSLRLWFSGVDSTKDLKLANKARI
jgi:hypothetical protein